MKKIACMLLTLMIALIAGAQTIHGTFAIKNVATGMVLRVKDANGANGTALVAYTPVN